MYWLRSRTLQTLLSDILHQLVFPFLHIPFEDIPGNKPLSNGYTQILAWQQIVYLFREETFEILIGEKSVFSDIRLHFPLIEGKSL